MKGKRILSTAMAALTLLTAPAALPQQALLLNPITASAAGTVTAYGKCGVTASWKLESDGTLTVYGSK